jgi:hypothetical protein
MMSAMFDRFRTQPSAAGGPPDLDALPSVPVGDPDGLAAVPPEVLGAYLGLTVAAVAGPDELGWTVHFSNGTSASIQLFPHDETATEFDQLRSKYQYQPSHDDLIELGIIQVRGAPYETYHEGGTLAARGRAHDVVVKSAGLHSIYFTDVLTGLAALTLRVLG